MYMETALNTKFIGVRRFVSELKLELPFERAQIIQELENEAWVPHGEVAPVRSILLTKAKRGTLYLLA